MIFTQNQIEEVLKIIKYYHVLFISKNLGTNLLSSNDKKLLKKFGVDISKQKEIPLANQAFLFGVLAETLGNKNAQSLTWSDFKKYIKEGKFIPLSVKEEEALLHAKLQAYSDIKGISGKIEKELFSQLAQKEFQDAIANRKTVQEVALELVKKTGDYRTDFGRIADTYMHSAYEEGRAVSLEKDFGEDVEVFKDVFPGACKYCIKAYLTAGIGSEPKVFKLSILRNNGSNNIGRKANQWLPVLGYMHPFCRCTLQRKRSGFKWNPKTRDFDVPIKEDNGKTVRRSKIIIKVGSKRFEA